MATIENYEYTIEDGATRTIDGVDIRLKCITINNTDTGQTVRINDITNVIERADWLKIAYTEAANTLTDTPNCCLTGQVEWVD